MRLFDPEDEPTISPTSISRAYGSLDDVTLQRLLVLDLDAGHEDPDLRKEFDARVSRAFLDVFSKLSARPDGTIIRLSSGLKQKLEESANYLDT